MKIEVVLDFDCTLTSQHLYHIIRSGYIRQLHNLETKCWDAESIKLVKTLQTMDAVNRSFSDVLTSRSFAHELQYARDFSNWIMGGTARLSEVLKFVSVGMLPTVDFHISTKGLVSEVVQLLRNVNLLTSFRFINGWDDQQESRVVYDVAFDHVTDSNFNGKEDFIQSFLAPDSHVYYLDDDNEYYASLRKHGIRCVDIGPKESAGALSENIMKNMRYSFVAMVCQEEQMACEKRNALTGLHCKKASQILP